MTKLEEIKFHSELFSVKKLTNGVYALIEKKAGQTGSNAGIIEIGDDLVVFDTFLSIDAANELKELCLNLTGKRPSYIVNSHGHADHIMGNYLFSNDAKIISSKGTRDIIEDFKKSFDQEKHQYVERVKEINESLITATDQTEIANLKNELNYVGNFAKPDVSIKGPDITFEEEVVLHGEQKHLYLKAYPIAHYVGDVIAYLPDDKICFTGDLLFAESHPWLGNGEPEKTIRILEELLEYDIDYFVPGHGPVATKKDVELQVQYIKEIIQLVDSKRMLDNPTFSTAELSPVFNSWNDLTFQWNINFLLERN